MRTAEVTRNTAETQISLQLGIDGGVENRIDTGCGFLNHMLTLFCHHGRFGIAVTAKGDIDVDYHHLAEDLGIVLGTAFAKALGDKRGICRYGEAMLPMDEALISVCLDISGRAGYCANLSIPSQKVGGVDTELVDEFFTALCRGMGLTLHILQHRGSNSHHIIEGAFKALARALRKAVSFDPSIAGEIPSSKGAL
ncbi:MAG: imidazoleglycerol-phosphate dehydratase HisB [Christensenellales bacterium]|jgi:imidazoleglycerol-phosphate dehydratase